MWWAETPATPTTCNPHHPPPPPHYTPHTPPPQPHHPPYGHHLHQPRHSNSCPPLPIPPPRRPPPARARMPELRVEYSVDPRRQAIADSWPESLDDSAAREEWSWKHQYGLAAMVDDMLRQLRKGA